MVADSGFIELGAKRYCTGCGALHQEDAAREVRDAQTHADKLVGAANVPDRTAQALKVGLHRLMSDTARRLGVID